MLTHCVLVLLVPSFSFILNFEQKKRKRLNERQTRKRFHIFHAMYTNMHVIHNLLAHSLTEVAGDGIVACMHIHNGSHIQYA